MATDLAQARYVAVTRCLSPVGTGNDETGSAGLSGALDFRSVELLVAHCASLVGKYVCAGSSTAFAAELNIVRQKISAQCFEPPSMAILAEPRSVCIQKIQITPHCSHTGGPR
jgi:hypothetical protein